MESTKPQQITKEIYRPLVAGFTKVKSPTSCTSGNKSFKASNK